MSELDASDKPAPTHGAPGLTDRTRNRFFAALHEALAQHRFVRLVLAKPLSAAADPIRVTVRELMLRGERSLAFVSTHATRDLARNLPLAEGLAAIDAQVGTDFAHVHLDTASMEIELRVGKKGRYGMSQRTVQREAPGSAHPAPHDRAKQRLVDIGRPWLADLGVTDAQGRLVPAMARKWKQINRFVEVFEHAFATSPLQAAKAPLRVVDFGSGKGYLTFAIHDHLRLNRGVEAEVVGVELRPELVALGNRAAQRAAAAGLSFVEGDVRSYTPGGIDVMIALHACDTATDHALHLGLRAGASIILCSPCCHKQLRPQMCAPPVLGPMLQHGIHLGQQAEMVTDSLRALLLEAEGYATQVFEFVALEHTSKNKMILAVRREHPAGRESARAQIGAIKAFYGIREHCLETLLAADGAAA